MSDHELSSESKSQKINTAKQGGFEVALAPLWSPLENYQGGSKGLREQRCDGSLARYLFDYDSFKLRASYINYRMFCLCTTKLNNS